MRLSFVPVTAALLLTGLSGAVVSSGPPARPAQAPTAVLVELFTSEGCSSCPAADTLLTRMLAEQPIDGVEIVGLSLHVDYWNRLGWKDPYSKAEFTVRQNEYASIWGPDRVYTPQAVVDGSKEFVGSDWPAARKHILEAAAMPKVPVTVDMDAKAPGSDQVSVRVSVGASAVRASKVNVLLAVAEDGLVSEVRSGENANRTLSHVGVVRELRRVARVDAAAGGTTTTTVKLNPRWRSDQLRLVAFVQDPESHKVIGVAMRRLRTVPGD